MKRPEWTKQAVATLLKHHARALSFVQIAAEMGLTKSAVAGKLFRLGYSEPRNVRSPVPLKRTAGKRLIEGPTLPPISAPADPTPPATTFRTLTSYPCQWPLGEPRKPGFRYCDAPGVPGRPYCGEHLAIAYDKPRPRGSVPVFRGGF